MRPWTKVQEDMYCLALEKADKGDVRGAVGLLRTLAKQGDATAQHALAHTLGGNSPIPKRWKEVSGWYRRAVRNGNPLSAWNLALDYAARGQPRWQMHWLKVYARMARADAIEDMIDWAARLRKRRKTKEMIPYLELAAKLGDAGAQNDFAILLEPKVKPFRIKEALLWYRKAVKRGSKEAAHNLSLHYRDNDDAKRRLQWLQIATKMGHPEAKKELRQLERAKRRV